MAIWVPPARAADPISATARVVDPGPHFVGQGIEVRVEVKGGAEGPRPTIEPPAIGGAEVIPVPSAPDDKSAMIRLRVVPRQPGPLVIPAIRTRRGDGSGVTRPVRLTIAGVPVANRGGAFLGGVGTFEVKAVAEPAAIRSGQSLVLRLTLSGPAAWGSLRAPDLAGWATLMPGSRVEPVPGSGELSGTDPPTRTFGYRIRMTRGGRVVLPPVAVAAFDPARHGYATRYSNSVAVEVAEPTPFDPRVLDDGGGKASPRSRWVDWVGAGGTVAGTVVTLAVTVIRWRRRKASRVDPRRLAAELAAGLDSTGSGAEVARRITEGVALWLGRVGGRPEGVLTPPEAAAAVARLTEDDELARRAAMLIERCDRAWFGGPGAEVSDLITEARGFFVAIGDATVEKEKGAKEAGPREAAETAKSVPMGRSGTASR